MAEPTAEVLAHITKRLLTRRAATPREARASRTYRNTEAHKDYQKKYNEQKRAQLSSLKAKISPEQMAELMAEAKKRLGHS